MGWASRILTQAELQPSLNASEPESLRQQVSALIAQQQATWPMLQAATAGLAQVTDQPLDVHGSRVIAQFNPARLVSTGAKVDAASIRQRPCFLCADHLPLEEQGIEFGKDFVILCNPFPVLRDHLVITHRAHTPQAIAGNFAALLDLAQALGNGWFALYNGPACGASAPDHLHFQACDSSLLPIVQDLEQREKKVVSSQAGLEVFTLPGYRVNLLVARGSNHAALNEWFAQMVSHLAEVTGASAEPMLNLVVLSDGVNWTVCVFPRSKHRPACYFAEGEAKLTISPAGIDLAGVLVVPEAAHFARINETDVEQIYAEVTLDDLRLAELIRRIA